MDYISDLMDDSIDSFGDADSFEIAQDVLDHICEYLYRKHDISSRRPMILEDENGEEFFEEFPYECMEFDDPDNPVYSDILHLQELNQDIMHNMDQLQAWKEELLATTSALERYQLAQSTANLSDPMQTIRGGLEGAKEL